MPSALRPLVVHCSMGEAAFWNPHLPRFVRRFPASQPFSMPRAAPALGRADCAMPDGGTVRKEKTEESGLHARAAEVATDVKGNSDDQAVRQAMGREAAGTAAWRQER